MNEEIIHIATLQSEVKTLTGAVRELTISMQKNNERLERVAVLEVSHNNSNHAIERAFEAIGRMEENANADRAVNEKAHKSYDKAIWGAMGFVTAISIFWAVFGYTINNTLTDTNKLHSLIQMHVIQDKVMTEQDVLTVKKP